MCLHPYLLNLYGMYALNRGKIIAIRHVFTPTISFVFTPDFGSSNMDITAILEIIYHPNPIPFYSIFDGGIYGTAPEYKSGFINYSLSNNLEMKVRSKKDTVTGTKKIVLIDYFIFQVVMILQKIHLIGQKLILRTHHAF